jgi:hypothetical protein
MGLSGLSHLNLQEQGINFATRCIELQHAVRILEKKNLELQEKAAMKEEEVNPVNLMSTSIELYSLCFPWNTHTVIHPQITCTIEKVYPQGFSDVKWILETDIVLERKHN